jgi:filamentous hemagglutinin
MAVIAKKPAIWTQGNTGSPAVNAFKHWQNHRTEFPELHSAIEYVRSSRNFFRSPPPSGLRKVRPNGEILLYDPGTNTFGAFLADGTPKSFFRPTGGISYWNKQ